MKIKKYLIPFFLLFFVAFTSCDKINEPYIKPGNGSGEEPVETVRKILLEEYTGHRCNNCPAGAAIAKKLQEIYGNQIIVMTVHAGILSLPANPPYNTNYRTASGNEWDSHFNVGNQGYPSGIINREYFDGKIVLEKDSWAEIVSGLITLEPDASIVINPVYNETNRELKLHIDTEFLNQLEGNFYLQVCLLESGLVSAQQNSDPTLGDVPDILNYVHNHVLRESINGNWGETLTNEVELEQTYSKTYEITLDEKYVAENCSIVAFIFDSETRTIVQAEEVHIIE